MRKFIAILIDTADRSIGHGPVRSLSAAVILALAAGCGGEAKREPVSGSVKWQGQDLALGRIQFSPTTDGGLPVGSEIRDGRFTLPNPPGLATGNYWVRIHSRGTSASKGARGPDFEIADPRLSEVIPQKYNDQTTLVAEVVRGENTFDFDLTGTREVPAAKKRSGPPIAPGTR